VSRSNPNKALVWTHDPSPAKKMGSGLAVMHSADGIIILE